MSLQPGGWGGDPDWSEAIVQFAVDLSGRDCAEVLSRRIYFDITADESWVNGSTMRVPNPGIDLTGAFVQNIRNIGPCVLRCMCECIYIGVFVERGAVQQQADGARKKVEGLGRSPLHFDGVPAWQRQRSSAITARGVVASLLQIVHLHSKVSVVPCFNFVSLPSNRTVTSEFDLRRLAQNVGGESR